MCNYTMRRKVSSPRAQHELEEPSTPVDDVFGFRNSEGSSHCEIRESIQTKQKQSHPLRVHSCRVRGKNWGAAIHPELVHPGDERAKYCCPPKTRHARPDESRPSNSL